MQNWTYNLCFNSKLPQINKPWSRWRFFDVLQRQHALDKLMAYTRDLLGCIPRNSGTGILRFQFKKNRFQLLDTISTPWEPIVLRAGARWCSRKASDDQQSSRPSGDSSWRQKNWTKHMHQTSPEDLVQFDHKGRLEWQSHTCHSCRSTANLQEDC